MMMKGTRRRRPGLVIAAIALILTMSSCMQEVPIVSNDPGNKTTNMTLEEQREWVGKQFDAAIDASGVEDGWFKTRRTLPWSDAPDDRKGILNMLFPQKCGSGARLSASLYNASAEDPFQAAERVRVFWESKDWKVSDIRSYVSDPYFRADREDGAVLAFQASSRGVSLEVESACSVNGTVVNWRRHYEEKNEFAEELKRRGEGAAE